VIVGGCPYCYSISVSPIAKDARHAADDWYSSPPPPNQRRPRRGWQRGAARAISRHPPVPGARSAACVRLMGNPWRRVADLSARRPVDALGQKIFADHLSLHEDPYLPRGHGSSPFDEEGVRGLERDVVADGVLQGYFLSTYSARKLGMKSTGNAGQLQPQLKSSD
jgi:PmbA protein